MGAFYLCKARERAVRHKRVAAVVLIAQCHVSVRRYQRENRQITCGVQILRQTERAHIKSKSFVEEIVKCAREAQAPAKDSGRIERIRVIRYSVTHVVLLIDDAFRDSGIVRKERGRKIVVEAVRIATKNALLLGYIMIDANIPTVDVIQMPARIVVI